MPDSLYMFNCCTLAIFWTPLGEFIEMTTRRGGAAAKAGAKLPWGATKEMANLLKDHNQHVEDSRNRAVMVAEAVGSISEMHDADGLVEEFETLEATHCQNVSQCLFKLKVTEENVVVAGNERRECE